MAVAFAACSSGPPSTPGTTTTTTSRIPSTTSSTGGSSTTAAGPTTSVPVVGRCQARQLAGSLGPQSAAAGTIFGTFILKNTSPVTCFLFGYPSMGMFNAANQLLPTNVVRSGNYPSLAGPPARVTIAVGGAAVFGFAYSDVPVGSETVCPSSKHVVITPPDNFVAIAVPARLAPCNHGTITVSPIRPPS